MKSSILSLLPAGVAKFERTASRLSHPADAREHFARAKAAGVLGVPLGVARARRERRVGLPGSFGAREHRVASSS